jgi:hypothetical protein
MGSLTHMCASLEWKWGQICPTEQVPIPLRSGQMIAHRNTRGEGERVELMQVKEDRCSLGPVGRMDGRELLCMAVFVRARLSYLLSPVTEAFRGKS